MSEFKNEGPGVYKDSSDGTCTVYRVSKNGKHLIGTCDHENMEFMQRWFARDGHSLAGRGWPSLIRRIGPLTLPEQIEGKPLRMKEGGRYVMRGGGVTGVIRIADGVLSRFADGDNNWQADGARLPSGRTDPRDLIREATPEEIAEIAEADGAVTLQLEVGKRYMRRDGKVTAPFCRTRHEKFPWTDCSGHWWDGQGRQHENYLTDKLDLIRLATAEEIAEADGAEAPTEPVYGWQYWSQTQKEWRLSPSRTGTEAEAEPSALRSLVPGDVFRTCRLVPGPAKKVEASTTKHAVPCEEPCPTPVTFSTGASQ